MANDLIAVVDDTRFDAHHARGQHPECPERLDAARDGLRTALQRNGIDARSVDPREADRSELTRVHGDAYVRRLESALVGNAGQLDRDTFFSTGTRMVAWSAAGAVIDLAERLWDGDAQRGIALVRPPGHHAEANRAMGFCLLNNVAIAAQAILARGAQRVAIVDWDVHHGNGTQNAFYDDPRVLFISLHQSPFYPGTGAAFQVGKGPGRGFTANIPLPAYSGPEAYAEAFRRVVLPTLAAYDPEMILVSAGFDAHARDPLASMQLDAETFRAMASALIRQSLTTAQGRVAWVLEGGYDLHALRDCVAAVTEAACGNLCDLPAGSPRAAEIAAIESTVHALREHWPTLR